MLEGYAVVKDGVVINTIVWDGVTNWEIPDGCIVVRAITNGAPVAGIGWTYSNGQFTPPKVDPNQI